MSKLKRYDVTSEGPNFEGHYSAFMVEDATGIYVKYSDVEPLIEAVRYYANPNNWRSDGGLDFHPDVRLRIKNTDEWHPEDETISDQHVSRIGGKTARDAFYISGIMDHQALDKIGVGE